MDFYKVAGGRIQRHRKLLGLTRDELAEKAGISSKFLYEVETGRKGFSAITLRDICDALGVKSDYILNGEEQIDCDNKLMETMHLFDEAQSVQLSKVLKEIYELL